ncbi:ATP-binding protein [Actinoallomurus purpureus]|uniref:ATP-binding protein n=1 Tax=Actinoallomurus purpureus TaxID=478114 RepID=UPI0020924A06|nr:ATP-binding protein [Actinoallomurus purpureus]MCO6003659.1 ATP-binding protein [Actinoallomurus purpureus]
MDVLDLEKPGAWVPPTDTGELRIYRAEPSAARLARVFVRECLTACDRKDLIENAEEVISELATNAIRHGTSAGGYFAVRFECHRKGCIFDVIDRCPKAMPVLRDADDLDEGGRGLHLVEALTDSWGYFRRPLKQNRVFVKVVRVAFI